MERGIATAVPEVAISTTCYKVNAYDKMAFWNARLSVSKWQAAGLMLTKNVKRYQGPTPLGSEPQEWQQAFVFFLDNPPARWSNPGKWCCRMVRISLHGQTRRK